MLVVEVLPRLGKPCRGVTERLERDMVAGAQVPVAPPYGPDVHVCEAERRCVQNEASELARLAVVLAAGRLQERDVVRGHIGWHALHEQPQREGIRWMAVERLAGAHDVVAEHGL